MTWTRTVVRTVPTGSGFESSVLFTLDGDTDGVLNEQHSFAYRSPEELLGLADAKRDELEAKRIGDPSAPAGVDVGTNLDDLALSATPIDRTGGVLTVDPVTPPAGFDTWSALWATYLRLQSLFDRGVPSVTAQRVSDAKAAHQAAYKSTFEPFLL